MAGTRFLNFIVLTTCSLIFSSCNSTPISGAHADSTPPTVGSALAFSNVSGTGMTVTWGAATDDITSQANLQYKLVRSTSNNLTTTTDAEKGTTVLDWTAAQLTSGVTGLSSSTTYYFNVLVKDSAGNKSVYRAASQATSDTTTPAAGAGLTFSAVNGTGMTVSWGAATDNATAQNALQYKLVRSASSNITGVANAESNGTTVLDWTANTVTFGVTGLANTTTYYFNVLVKDAAGNKTVYGTASQITSGAGGDVTPPTIGTGLVFSGITGTGITVTWGAATDDVTAAGSLQYKLVRSTSNNITGVANAESNGTIVMDWTAGTITYAATGLTGSTLYYFNVLVKDGAGNKSAYTTASQTTAGWIATPGSLSGGTWQAPAHAPDSAHAGGYGGIAYAPNDDLYLFFQKGVYPNENLCSDIRRHTGTTWSFDGSEKILGNRARTANVYFQAGVPLVVSESFGSVFIFTCSNCGIDGSISWSSTFNTIANDGNPDGVYPLNNGFITTDGSNLNLFFTYLYYDAVSGGESWGMQSILQSGAAWPADNTLGNAYDVQNTRPIYSTWPHGMSGAFQSGSTILSLSSRTFRSTNSGSSFTQIMNSGTAANDLSGVSGAALNSTDNSIVMANFYNSGGWHLAIWGTQDYGANFYKLNTSALGTPYRGKVVATQNLLMVLYTTDYSGGESLLWETHSYDGGLTWTGATNLVDATSELGSHPTWTIGDFSAASSSTGSIALQYSIMNGNTNQGVYLKEFH